MGGPGSGGARSGAGRLRRPIRRPCEWCRRRFDTYRRNRRFCEDHRRPELRRGDRRSLVLATAVQVLRAFDRQFACEDVAAAVAAVRATFEAEILARAATARDRFLDATQ